MSTRELLSPSPEQSLILQLSQSLQKELVQRGLAITITEGCSGGALTDAITIPGATSIFHTGAVVYSPEVKLLLGVPKDLIDRFGEYSPEVAHRLSQLALGDTRNLLSVATVGQLSSTKPQGIYTALTMHGREHWVSPLHVPPLSRAATKSLLTQRILEKILMYITSTHRFEEEKYHIRYLRPTSRNYMYTPLVAEVIDLLRSRDQTFITVESCTGGALANAITNVEGASNVFQGGLITYDEDAKAQLSVPFDVMTNGNVYSEVVALEMARAGKRMLRADIAISTTGVMENLDTRPYHTDTKPGTVYYTLLTTSTEHTGKLILPPTSRAAMKKAITEHVFTKLTALLTEEKRTLPVVL